MPDEKEAQTTETTETPQPPESDGEDAQRAAETAESGKDESSPPTDQSSQLEALTARLDRLMQLLESDETQEVAPSEKDDLARLYRETFGTSPTEEASEPGMDEPVTRRDLLKMAAEMERSKKEIAGHVYQAELRRLRAAYPDWKGNEDKILKLSGQHPTLSGDEVYALWKAQQVGFENLSRREQTKAVEAAQSAKEAKRAASEKPSASGTGTKREPQSFAEAARMAYEEAMRTSGGK